MALLNDLEWRYATKKYDPTKKVSQENVDKIVEAARLAPTSSGMQQFRVFVISNQEIKDQLVSIANGQQIVADASHVLVFAAWDQYTEERIDNIFGLMTKERGLPANQLVDYTNRLKAVYLNQAPEENFVHTAKQAYIGFGLSIAQAAELKVDATPMEGFNADQLDELLELKSKGLKSVLMLPLGYRQEEGDWLVNMKKVRIPKEDFAKEI